MPNENPALMNQAFRNLLSEVCPKALPIAEFRARHPSMPLAVWAALSLAIATAMDADVAPYLDLLEGELKSAA